MVRARYGLTRLRDGLVRHATGIHDGYIGVARPVGADLRVAIGEEPLADRLGIGERHLATKKSNGERRHEGR